MKFVIIKTMIGDRDTYQRNLKLHQTFLRSLQKKGILSAAGVFDDRSGGMLVIEAEGLEDAIAVARKDPLVQAGVERYQVRGWKTSHALSGGENASDTPPISPVKTGRIQAPPPEEDNFQVLEASHYSYGQDILNCCLAPSNIQEDNRWRQGYVRVARPRGLEKILLVHEDTVAGQIEFAPPDASGLPIEGAGVSVVHCIWVLDAYTGLDGGRRLLAACAERAGTTSLATVAFNDSLPLMPSSFFKHQGFTILDSVETGRFRGNTPIVAYLMWRPVQPDADQPTWDPAKLLRGVDLCPAYPWMFGKRLYWGRNYEYRGVLVKEGLRRPEVLLQLPELARKRTDNWTFFEIGIPEADLNRGLELVQAALLDSPCYFAHIYGAGRVIIVYPDRIFFTTEDKRTQKEAVQYGVDKGIPADELVFTPFGQDK